MGNGETAGFFGVVSKICLSEHIGIVTDNFNGLLVRTDCAVRTETEEFALDCAFRNGIDFMTDFQGKEGHIVFDAHCEVVFRSAYEHIVKYGESHGGSKVF